MRWGSIYLVVRDFEKAVSFYEKILDMKVSTQNGTRFAMFNFNGMSICIMNGYFDSLHPEKIKRLGEYIAKFDDMDKIADSNNTRKVFINLGVDDLKKEYDRIVSLDIVEELSSIRFIEYVSPYWYFTLSDPDGNPIEITGRYDG